jgi:hypothetical protein
MRNTTAALSLLITFTACSRNLAPGLSQPDCAGQGRAIVTNRWSESVDIRAQADGKTDLTLGEVGPNQHSTFALPSGTRWFVYPYRRYGLSSRARELIEIRYECG